MQVYLEEACARTFHEDLWLHLTRGYVWSSPAAFVMARPVLRVANDSMIADPTVEFDPALADCWHVYLLAGDWREALEHLPWETEWLSWERNNKMRFYKLEALRRKLSHEEYCVQSF